MILVPTLDLTTIWTTEINYLRGWPKYIYMNNGFFLKICEKSRFFSAAAGKKIHIFGICVPSKPQNFHLGEPKTLVLNVFYVFKSYFFLLKHFTFSDTAHSWYLSYYSNRRGRFCYSIKRFTEHLIILVFIHFANRRGCLYHLWKRFIDCASAHP